MSIVVFLGPSLTRAKARKILPDAVYLPPAAQMDLMSAVRIHKPRAIALIDGVFECVPSVWHKEILYALQHGIAVYGASSMGALRVAETAAFGAIGVGQVFRMYAEEDLLDDDEVALSHAGEEFSFRPLTEPMVNVRATISQAVERGLVDPALAERLLVLAKAQHFTQRTFASILEAADLQPELELTLEQVFRSDYVDLKARDATELLTLLRDTEISTHVPNFTLQESTYFRRQQRREQQVARPTGKVALERIVSHYALHCVDFEEVNFAALNVTLVQLMAELLQVEVGEDDRLREERRLRLWLGIKEADLEGWMADNDLDPADYRDLIAQRATCRVMHGLINREGYRGTRTTTALLHQLRSRGQYSEWADKAASHEAAVARDHPDFPQPEHDVEDTGKLVLEHLRATACRMPLSYHDWGREAGFLYDDSLKLELLKARLVRQSQREMLVSLGGDTP